MIRIDEINGYVNRKIKVIIDDDNADNLFILYPGMKYGYNHPFFYYLRMMLKLNNIDYIFFDYNWSEQKELFKLADEKVEREVTKEIMESFEFIKRQKDRKISLLGKSIGSTALEIFHEKSINSEFNIDKIFWITPFLNTKKLIDIKTFNKEKEFIYVGTSDTYYNENYYNIIEDKVNIRKFEGLGHSFESGNDIVASIEGLKNVFEVLRKDIFE